MSKILREQLSAFLDDELQSAEQELVARRLAADPDLRATASSFSLIGDVLRGELSCADPLAFGRRVAAQVEAPLKVAAAERSFGRGWGRALAGSGVAAVVAVVAVLTLRTGDPADTGAPSQTVPLADQQSAPVYTVPSALSRRAGTPDRLSRYYLNHSEYASLLGGQGSLVRIVSGPPPEHELDTEAPVDEPVPETDTTEP